MDLHKLLAEDVRSRAERDAARGFLRRGYESVVRGTEWEALYKELREDLDEVSGPIELYEVEGRGVGVVWPATGMGHAWVWSDDSWVYAPGLVNKSWLEGHPLSVDSFAAEFPEADLPWLEELARGALWSSGDMSLFPGKPPLDGEESELVLAGSLLMKIAMRQHPGPFEELASRIAEGLNKAPDEINRYVLSWYCVARTDLGDPPQTDEPWIARQKLGQWLEKPVEVRKEPFDRFLELLPAAIAPVGRARCSEIAQSVRAVLRDLKPSGIFDYEGHENLWDEFCSQVQSGPDLLRGAWTETLDPIVDHQIQQLAKSELILLSLWRRYDEDDFADADFETWSPEAIRRGVIAELVLLTNEAEQS
jgi:hypothetical protein